MPDGGSLGSPSGGALADPVVTGLTKHTTDRTFGFSRVCSFRSQCDVIFGGRQKAVESLIERYLHHVGACVDGLISCIEQSLKGEPLEALSAEMERTCEEESQADDVRREIAMLLYGKALFPESRGDILGLLEAVDRVPNKAETVVRHMRHQGFEMPRDLSREFRALTSAVQACSRELVRAVRELFDNYPNAMFLADRVGELESEADDAEYALMERVFSSSRETADKILLRDMGEAIGSIADRAEDASDRIRIIAVKRKV